MFNIYLDFIVWSEKKNVDLDSVIPLPKESSHKIGDLWRGKKLNRSEWRYVSETYSNVRANEILKIFYNSIKDCQEELIKVIKDCDGWVDIYFVVERDDDEEMQHFSIDSELVKFCASINASIGVD